MLVVVSGAPCSGKSTYVAGNASSGNDIVIDLDRIALAFAIEGTGDHDYPDHIRAVARKARLAAIELAIQYARQVNVWLIEASPSYKARSFYARAGARFVHLTATPEELAERINRRPERNQALIRTLGGA